MGLLERMEVHEFGEILEQLKLKGTGGGMGAVGVYIDIMDVGGVRVLEEVIGVVGGTGVRGCTVQHMVFL